MSKTPNTHGPFKKKAPEIPQSLRVFGDTPEEVGKNIAFTIVQGVQLVRWFFEENPKAAEKIMTDVKIRTAFMTKPSDGKKDG